MWSTLRLYWTELKLNCVVTWELAGHPTQTECRKPAAQGPDGWSWSLTFPQWVLDGEVVSILLQRVIQRVHKAILPQLVQHYCWEMFREACNSAITVIKVNIRHAYSKIDRQIDHHTPYSAQFEQEVVSVYSVSVMHSITTLAIENIST